VGISESKPDMDKVQTMEKNLASYAKQEAVGYICDAAAAAASGFPVCGLVRFFSDISSGFWDLFQNTPSSSSGLNEQSYEMVGLGGNVNSVTIQLYDPYNFPAVNLFESSGC
jgi:hypothetical protein